MIGWFSPFAPTTVYKEFAAGLATEAELVEAIAPGPEGNMWFVNTGETGSEIPAIGVITPVGTVTEYTAGLSRHADKPVSIAAGPEGDMWFADKTKPAIGKITPGGVITLYTRPGLKTGAEPVAIAAGPDGNMWFTDEGSTKAIGKITTGATPTITETAAPGTEPEV